MEGFKPGCDARFGCFKAGPYLLVTRDQFKEGPYFPMDRWEKGWFQDDVAVLMFTLHFISIIITSGSPQLIRH